MARIAVEETLSDVKALLEQSGHDVVTLEGDNAAGCDCSCVSGQNQNVMGMSEATSDASIVNCDGMTAQEVVEEVNERLQKRS
ncbi:YkuS family protein [Piscibacillus salipiscarius]|uniref:YkuS family protein n=1 Tax=Piscibacillus salipiscarius TaxID=299480 RepID=A0ABW5QEC7_9BACI|nr:YkuS family protein [Piscibacillus salipiscarius]